MAQDSASSTDIGPWRRELSCFRCDRVAAALLVDPRSGGRGLTLTLAEFLVRKTTFLSVPAAEGIAEAEGAELLRWLPLTFQGFFCRECDAAYCRACWTAEPPDYEAGVYAGTYGTCPGGHRSLLDG